MPFFVNTLLIAHLQGEDDDQEEAVGGEHDPALLQGPAVPEEGDEEDESADGDEYVGDVVQHGGVGELLQYVVCLVIALQYIIRYKYFHQFWQ